jgi:hypothetical protein
MLLLVCLLLCGARLLHQARWLVSICYYYY